MKGKQLLFVAHHDENFGEGLSYAVDLARTMGNSIGMLMVYKKKETGELGNIMTTVASGDPGRDKTARELISEDYGRRRESFEEKLSLIEEICRKGGVDVDVSTAATEVVSAIKKILKENAGIGMVLLSPGITNDSDITTKALTRLVKAASRPIVTMAKQAGTA